MFCSQCGKRQVAEPARFCCFCGFHLDSSSPQPNTQERRRTAALPAQGSVHPFPFTPVQTTERTLTPRQRGVRQGFLMMLSTLLVVPLVAILGGLTLGLPLGIVPASALICLIGGLLRIVHALMFAGGEAVHARQFASPGVPLFAPAQPDTFRAYSSSSSTQITDPATLRPGLWRTPETGELWRQPESVTENPTRLLRMK